MLQSFRATQVGPCRTPFRHLVTACRKAALIFEDQRKRLLARRVNLSALLMGGESFVSGKQFARISGDFLRPSTSIAHSPHAKLLEQWKLSGDRVFEPAAFEQTEYFRNARLNIDVFGSYFDARRDSDVVMVARQFVTDFQNACSEHSARLSAPIHVFPISHSDCFSIYDGHHRAAIAHASGLANIRAYIDGPAVTTPLQDLLCQVLWLNGRRELYQPVDAPELTREWTVVRKCTDRFTFMSEFLSRSSAIHDADRTPGYLDVGCSYGWFVKEMRALGFDSFGVERDPFALDVGRHVYGLPAECLIRADCARFLEESTRTWDVVSCFSVLHHFVMGNGRMSAQSFIQALDRRTAGVLFIDTGEAHEEWYADKLRDWTPPFIAQWIRDNTTFSQVTPLGRDSDSRGPFKGALNRTLFVCTR